MRHLLLALLLAPPTLLPAADLTGALQAFEAKLSAANAAKSPQAQPDRNLLQLKTLEMLLKRRDYERAGQILPGLSYFEVPADLQSEWLDLVEELTAGLAEAERVAMEQWRQEVAALGETARTACLEATTPADLDEALVACAALQLQRRGQNNVLGQVIYKRLSGIAETLERWSGYLEFRAAGNAKSANGLLQNLLSSSSDYPLLTNDEIEAAMLPEPIAESTDVAGALFQAVADIATPADVPPAIERLEILRTKPNFARDQQIASALTHLRQIAQASQALEDGKPGVAIRTIEPTRGGFTNVNDVLEATSSQLLSAALDAEISRVAELTREPSEDDIAYIERALTELAAQSHFAAMLAVIDVASSLPRDRSSAAFEFTPAKSAIERILSAQRLEAIGEVPSAASIYRSIVAQEGDFVPHDAAVAALARLEAEKP